MKSLPLRLAVKHLQLAAQHSLRLRLLSTSRSALRACTADAANQLLRRSALPQTVVKNYAVWHCRLLGVRGNARCQWKTTEWLALARHREQFRHHRVSEGRFDGLRGIIEPLM